MLDSFIPFSGPVYPGAPYTVPRTIPTQPQGGLRIRTYCLGEEDAIVAVVGELVALALGNAADEALSLTVGAGHCTLCRRGAVQLQGIGPLVRAPERELVGVRFEPLAAGARRANTRVSETSSPRASRVAVAAHVIVERERLA